MISVRKLKLAYEEFDDKQNINLFIKFESMELIMAVFCSLVGIAIFIDVNIGLRIRKADVRISNE